MNVMLFKISKLFGTLGLKWGVVARFGLNMGGNEAREVQDHLKINCLQELQVLKRILMKERFMIYK